MLLFDALIKGLLVGLLWLTEITGSKRLHRFLSRIVKEPGSKEDEPVI
jgi:hypothetical protein